jgi:hypothetical protein
MDVGMILLVRKYLGKWVVICFKRMGYMCVQKCVI